MKVNRSVCVLLKDFRVDISIVAVVTSLAVLDYVVIFAVVDELDYAITACSTIGALKSANVSIAVDLITVLVTSIHTAEVFEANENLIAKVINYSALKEPRFAHLTGLGR